MSTAVAKSRKKAAPGRELDDQRFVIDPVSWSQYEELLKWLDDRPIRVTYDHGRLELMSPSQPHEEASEVLTRVIDVLTEEFGLPLRALGSTTIRRADLEKGFEPDRCFYIENAHRVRGKRLLDLSVDPPPDLVIEVDITSSSARRLTLYAQIGVPEVWRYDGSNLAFLVRGQRHKYHTTDTCARFPGIRARELSLWIERSVADDITTWRRAFRAWVRKQVAKVKKTPRAKNDS